MLPNYEATSGFTHISNEEVAIVNGGTGALLSRIGNAIRSVGRAIEPSHV